MSFFLTNVILSFFLSFFPSKHRRVVQVLSVFQRFFKTRSYRVFTVFYRIELGFTGFFTNVYQIGPDWTGFLLGFPFFRFLPGFTGFYRIVLLNMNWVSHISETFIEFYRTCTALLPSFTKFYRVIPNFTEYDLVLPSFT